MIFALLTLSSVMRTQKYTVLMRDWQEQNLIITDRP
jgi:hypothetical protein